MVILTHIDPCKHFSKSLIPLKRFHALLEPFLTTI